MKQPMRTWSSLFFSFLILCSLPILTIAQEAEDQKEFSYIEGSENGPENWGNIKEEWAQCNTGRRQSPIDLPPLTAQYAPLAQQITKFYQPGNAILRNRGHDLAVEWQEGNSKIILNGKDYILHQCHWHHPSEHAINGIRSALELHLVHQSEDGEIAVIGQLYNYGRPDPFLSMLSNEIQQLITGPSDEVNAGVIDPSETDIGWDGQFHRYYRYMGSLTTPPCDEGVIWSVNERFLGHPKTVSRYQVAQLRNAVHDDAYENARPLQPINGRTINLYYDILLENHNESTISTRQFVGSLEDH